MLIVTTSSKTRGCAFLNIMWSFSDIRLLFLRFLALLFLLLLRTHAYSRWSATFIFWETVRVRFETWLVYILYCLFLNWIAEAHYLCVYFRPTTNSKIRRKRILRRYSRVLGGEQVLDMSHCVSGGSKESGQAVTLRHHLFLSYSKLLRYVAQTCLEGRPTLLLSVQLGLRT